MASLMNDERPSSGSGGIIEGTVGEDVERIGHEGGFVAPISKSLKEEFQGNCIDAKSREGGASHPPLTHDE